MSIADRLNLALKSEIEIMRACYMGDTADVEEEDLTEKTSEANEIRFVQKVREGKDVVQILAPTTAYTLESFIILLRCHVKDMKVLTNRNRVHVVELSLDDAERLAGQMEKINQKPDLIARTQRLFDDLIQQDSEMFSIERNAEE